MAKKIAETPKKAARRREVLDVAYAEFVANGFGGTSMEAIARRARASKETLYAWFSDKDTLFATVVADRMETTVARVGRISGADPRPEQLLPVVAEQVLRLSLAISPLISALQIGEPGKEALRKMGEGIVAERSRFVALLLHWRDQGKVAFDDDPFELISVFVAMAVGEWGLRQATGITGALTDTMITEHARRVTRLFLRALAP